MEYITTKEASTKWGISTIRITVLANENRIPGAKRLGKRWLIPANATKPQEFKPHHSSPAREKRDNFSFPLYHFRHDYSYIKETTLSNQQQSLLLAETAVLECRFADAYPLLQSILSAPDDITIEIGCLWNIGICCIALNKPDIFSKIFLRLQVLLSEDFPHRDDLKIIFDALQTYIETLSTAANEYTFCADIHEQCLPTTCILAGYSQLTKEAMNPGSSDINLLELNLRLLKSTGALIAVEFIHLYLLAIYYLRSDGIKAELHAKLAVQLAFESKYYFPLVTYYRYFIPVLSPILAQYPEDFQKHCNELVLQYNENLNAFLSSMDEYNIISQITDTDFPYIYAILMDIHNATIAKKLGVSLRTVNRKYETLCEKLGVSSKKELKDFLHKYM